MKDADGKLIALGSVLEKIDTGEIGVVSRIVKEGEQTGLLEQTGDMKIEKTYGAYIVSSIYSSWRHVPHEKQTFYHRFRSWLYTPCNHDTDEDFHVFSITSLVDQDLYDEDSYPVHFQDALELMSKQLIKQERKIKSLEQNLKGATHD